MKFRDPENKIQDTVIIFLTTEAQICAKIL